MNIIFYGTPELCTPYLESLHSAGYTPVCIVTNPDRPVGRKQLLTPPATKIWGQQHNIPVYQPEKLNDEAFTTISKYQPDLQIVIAYGKIIPERFITLPHHGTINVHYSLLPRWRGASPVEAGILAGDDETGICIQQMHYELDSGPVLAQLPYTLTGTEYADELKMTLSKLGAPVLLQTITDIQSEVITPTEQDPTQITFCTKIQKSDGELLPSDTDEFKWRKYRAYHGWPGVFYFDTDGIRVKVTQAVFENGKFIIKKIIRAGEAERMTI